MIDSTTMVSILQSNAALEIISPHHGRQEFAPIAMIGCGPLLVVTSNDLGAKNITELSAPGQARPQDIDFLPGGQRQCQPSGRPLVHRHSSGEQPIQ